MGHPLGALLNTRPVAAMIFFSRSEITLQKDEIKAGLVCFFKTNVHNHLFSFTKCNQNKLVQNTAFETPNKYFPHFFDCGRLR